MRNCSDKSCRENQNTHIVFSNSLPPRKSCRLWGKVDKNIVESDRPQMNNTAHTHCVLDTLGCKHTLRICNTYRFSTAAMVARTGLDVTLHVIICRIVPCCNTIKFVTPWRVKWRSEMKPAALKTENIVVVRAVVWCYLGMEQWWNGEQLWRMPKELEGYPLQCSLRPSGILPQVTRN